MHLILHIFKKDVRRLWWGIAIALLIQTAAAWFDASESLVSGQLGILLIMTWAALIALAVHEDPLVSDRQFWITRPARWRVLLGSKLLFAIAVVHVPSFLADVTLLAVRGFRPWEWLASLLIKQVMLAAILTLPVIALAAVLPGFAHLALAVIAIVGLTSFASGFSMGLYSRWTAVGMDTRMILVGAVLAAAAMVIIPWQFARRKTWPSRLLGISGVLAAELLLAFVSPIFLARVHAAVTPIETKLFFHVRTNLAEPHDPTSGINYYPYVPPGVEAMRVPISVSGVPKGIAALCDPEMLDLIGPGNQRYQMRPTYIGPDWLILTIRRQLYERLKDGKVEIKGSVPVILHRDGAHTSMPVGTTRALPGVGRCSSDEIDVPGPSANVEHSRFLRVACESPDGSSLPALVKFQQSAEKALRAQLDWTAAPGLSPLKRGVVTFPLSPGEDPQPSWRLEITPDIPLGWQVVNLDLRDLRLGDYVSR
jgi:hypothetical protein